MTGKARGRWFAGILVAAAGCATPVQDPAEGPVPVLALVPGAVHLFHTAILATLNPGPKTGIKDMKMEYHVDATWQVVSVEPGGKALLDCTVHRIWGNMSVASYGMKVEFDSDDSSFRESMGKDNPMSKAFAPLVGGAGKVRRWVLRKGRTPTVRGEKKPKDGLDDILGFAWLDVLPPVPVKEGLRGLGLPVDLGSGRGMHAYAASWEVGSWDPATGLAEIAVRISARNPAAGKGEDLVPGALEIESAAVEMRDRFDTRAGTYVSRQIRAKADGMGSFFPMGDTSPEDVSMVMDVAIDRVESFAPAPPAPR